MIRTNDIHKITVGDFCLKGKLEKNTSSPQNTCAYEAVGLILQTWELQLITLKLDCLMWIHSYLRHMVSSWNRKGRHLAN